MHGFIIAAFVTVLLAHGSTARTVTLKNSCKEGLSIAYSDLSYQGKTPDHVRIPVAAGQAHPLDVGRKWQSARIWAGVGCSGEGAAITCTSGLVPPWTLAEFNLVDAQEAGQDANDDFDVSVVDGFNLPLAITYDEGKCAVPAEIAPKCDGNINAKCPQMLRTDLDSQGLNLGCYSACHAGFGDEKFGNRDCCTGAYGQDPQLCTKDGVDFYDLYKDLCPGAYAHAYDEASETALRQCKAKNEVDYTVEFCPDNTDYKGTESGAPDYAENWAKTTSRATTWTARFTQTMGPPRTGPGPAPSGTGAPVSNSGGPASGSGAPSGGTTSTTRLTTTMVKTGNPPLETVPTIITKSLFITSFTRGDANAAAETGNPTQYTITYDPAATQCKKKRRKKRSVKVKDGL